jgi:ABC-type branched-subunit amino acid transport system ATPase component
LADPAVSSCATKEGEAPLLRAVSIVAGYGKKQVLGGVSIDVSSGQVVALIGHNGAGKSTLLKAIFGMIPIRQGLLFLDGNLFALPTPHAWLRSGVVYVPQGNRVFSNLTVYENLEMAGLTVTNKIRLQEGIERALKLFPGLKARLKQRAGSLSGGEKQMLALSNALIPSPRLLLLDEPSLGLAPRLVVEAFSRIREITSSYGTSVLIVEQKVREVLKIAEHVYALRSGSVSFSGPADALNNDLKLRQVYL